MFGYLANSYSRLADSMQQSVDSRASLEYYRKAVAARLKVAEITPGSSANRGALAECYTNLGKALVRVDAAEALRQYDAAIALLDGLIVRDPNDAQNRKRLADALAGEARLYTRIASERSSSVSKRREEWERARSTYRRSHELWIALEREKKLEGADRQLPGQVGRELVACERLLDKFARR
jgi:tetratricopeptide (TPR) repeat protein